MGSKPLLREAVNNPGLLAPVVAAGLLGGLLAIAQAYCLALIIDGAFLGGQDLAGLLPLVYILLPVMAARAGLLWAGEVVGFRLAAGIQAGLRRQATARLFALGPVHAGGERAGELVNMLVQGIDSLEAYFAKYLPQLVTAAVIPPAILTVVFQLDPAAAAIMLVTAPFIPLFMALIGRWAGTVQRRQWGALSRLSGHFFDVLQGLATLKLFNRSREQVAVIARLSGQLRDTTLGVLRVAFLSALTLELLATLSTALVAVAVGLKLLYGGLEFRQAFFVLLLAPEYYLPLRLLGGHFHAGLAGATAAERIYGLLAGGPPAICSDGEPFAASRINVRFEGVTFTYPGGARPALHDVTFSIGMGECVALVGPSGAGKSTVADLLLGFIRPDSGAVTVNGRDLGGLQPVEWLAHVACVPQFPHLFAATVADNIGFGAPGGREAVEAAARAAGAHDFIVRLPAGYDTVIGEGGLGLSGGEAQRIALARAFFKDAPLVLLDEPASGLDPGNEALVRAALERLAAGRTVLVIAHRLSTACRADRIIVLSGGRIAEEGRHADLLAAGGAYRWLAAAYRGPA